ncbi:MAG: hemolysin III family protein [Halanaerobiales bacterium]|nr:hemolysin III family protein [Halanaerobiales bacterium]
MKSNINYTKKEEISNAITHGIGVLFGIFALIFLIVTNYKNSNFYDMLSYIIYGSSLIMLYIASTLYHAVSTHKVKQTLRKLDHASIFLLIAGTYTPVALISLRGRLGWTIFITVWTIAIIGVLIKILYIDRLKISSVIFYLLMGWLIIFIIKPIILTLSTKSLIFLIVGGLSYTVGTVFFGLQSLGYKYSHTIWHLFVLAGSISHFMMIYFIK